MPITADHRPSPDPVREAKAYLDLLVWLAGDDDPAAVQAETLAAIRVLVDRAGVRSGLGDLGELPTLTVVPCPYCGSRDTTQENPFGPTLCRAIYHCAGCRQPFEAFKPI